MSDPIRWPRESWFAIAAGLVWLWSVPSHGVLGALLLTVPGALLLAGGVALLMAPGDDRIPQLAALGGSLGLIVALPAMLVVGFGVGLLLAASAWIGMSAAGWYALRTEAPIDEVPDPPHSLRAAGEIAIDEALLSTFLLTAQLPRRDEHGHYEGEMSRAREVFRDAGWLEKPADYHASPPPLEDPTLRARRLGPIHYEHLTFESGYAPHPEEPGRERWLSYAPNRTAHAWVVRHESEHRPWLVCIHGYQMGRALIDLGAFDPTWLHERLGINLLIPTLPFHGKRKTGRRSGDGFVVGNTLDTVHAMAQAMWDIRRMLTWVRAQGRPPVGVMGYSLGGYAGSLLACLDENLACAIAGIPATDFTRTYYKHGPDPFVRRGADVGVDEETMRDVLSVVSPLVLQPRVPYARRYIFAAIADRIVPADQPRDLWRHWERPRIEWYPGAHVTFRAYRGVFRLVRDALTESGLAR